MLVQGVRRSRLQLRSVQQVGGRKLVAGGSMLQDRVRLAGSHLSLRRARGDVILMSRRLSVLLKRSRGMLLQPSATLLCRTITLRSCSSCVIRTCTGGPIVGLLHTRARLTEGRVHSAGSFSLPNVSLCTSGALTHPISHALTSVCGGG